MIFFCKHVILYFLVSLVNIVIVSLLFAGVIITVHNQTTMAFPEDDGFSMMPGTKTNVAIKRVY